MIGSPSFANRFAKSLLVVRSHQGLLVVRLRHVRVAWIVRTVTSREADTEPHAVVVAELLIP